MCARVLVFVFFLVCVCARARMCVHNTIRIKEERKSERDLCSVCTVIKAEEICGYIKHQHPSTRSSECMSQP